MSLRICLAFGALLMAGFAAGFNLEPRIVDGSEVSYGTDPNAPRYMVAVLPDGYLCGGSYIGERMIVTAAHCTEGFEPAEVKVGFSEDGRLFNGSFLADGVTLIGVIAVHNHPDYDEDADPQFDHDIAVLILSSDPPPYAQPVAFFSTDDVSTLEADESVVRAYGWGLTEHEGDTSDVLLEVDMNLETFTSCFSTWGSQLSVNMICAGAANAGKDTCQGDSGGPLAYLSASQPVLIGLTSFGGDCAADDESGVYIRVSNYLSWINDFRSEDIIPIDPNAVVSTTATTVTDSVVQLRTGNGALGAFWLAVLSVLVVSAKCARFFAVRHSTCRGYNKPNGTID